MAQDTGFNPFDTGELYQRHRDRWQLETDVAEMTLDVLSSGAYLPRFSDREHDDDYAYRKGMSVPLDMCRDGVRIRVDNLWRVLPGRQVDPASPHRRLIEALIHDADGDGTPLDAFMQRAVWNMYVTGVDIVTQVTQAPGGAEVRTKADQQRYGIRPYWMQFGPLDRYDWAVNGSGGILWARYCLGRPPRADEAAGDDADAAVFLTVGPGYWREHRASRAAGEGADGERVRVETAEGTHPLGRAPVIKFYFSESQKPGQGGVPLSLLTRPAAVARVMLNLKSQADADLLAAVTRWFATGVQDDLPDTISPNVLIKFPSPDSRLSVLQGDVGHIAEKRRWLLLYIGEVLRLLKFRGGMAEINASSGSGLKLAIERTDLDNELRATAARCEQVEIEMIRQAVCMVTGRTIRPEDAPRELGYSVRYNRDFILEPVAEMLANLAAWVGGCGTAAGDVPELTREMLRQLGGMLVREGTPVHRTILRQIDALRPPDAVRPGPRRSRKGRKPAAGPGGRS